MRSITETIKAKQKAREEPGLLKTERDILCYINKKHVYINKVVCVCVLVQLVFTINVVYQYSHTHTEQ